MSREGAVDTGMRETGGDIVSGARVDELAAGEVLAILVDDLAYDVPVGLLDDRDGVPLLEAAGRRFGIPIRRPMTRIGSSRRLGAKSNAYRRGSR